MVPNQLSLSQLRTGIIIDGIYFTHEDFMKCSEVIQKNKKYFSVNKLSF